MVVSINMNIVITYSLAIAVTIHSYKFRGLYKTLILFFGSWIIGGGIENVNSIFGGYYYPGSELTLFIGVCPFDVILGWYILIYCCSFFAHSLIGKGRGSLPIIGIGTAPIAIDKQFLKDTILRAALAGYIAIDIDFLIDPVAVENKWWIWQINNIYILGVPLGNYMGWWMLIFWGVFFHDLIMAYCSVNNKNEKFTSTVWSIGAITASLLTGLILEGFTIWWGMKGVRTEGMHTNALDSTITPERTVGILWALIMILAAIGLIMASSFVKNKFPEPRPTQYIWRILPSIIMLIFWALVMVVAVLTGPIFVAIGVIFCVPLLVLCVYLINCPLAFFK